MLLKALSLAPWLGELRSVTATAAQGSGQNRPSPLRLGNTGSTSLGSEAAEWGGVPEGGPALRLRAKRCLMGGSREPQREGREAGLAVLQELGGRGVLKGREKNIIDSRKRGRRAHNGKNDLSSISL